MNGVPWRVRVLLGVAERLVPGHRRSAWRRQWDAELAYKLRASGDRGAFGLAWGAFSHAVYLRREDGRMTGYLGDLRHSVRTLLRRPVFTGLSVLTLAGGIGASTAVFSLAEALLLRPLPLDHPDELVSLYTTNPSQGMDRFSVSYPDFADWTARSDLFSSAALYASATGDLSGDTEPVRLDGVSVGIGFFETLKSRMVIGRAFTREDQQPGSDLTVILSEGAWRRLFGADPSVVGRTVALAGRSRVVLGVVAGPQAFPMDADFWVPLRFGGVPPEWANRRSNHAWRVVARLRPGVSVATASTQVGEVAKRWYDANATGSEEGTTAIVVPLRSTITGDSAPLFVGIMGLAVFFVLLIACMNQSNLLLTHTFGRARELSLRAALGAGRGRLVALVLGESVILALAGGALGVGLASVALGPLMRLAPVAIPPELSVHMDWTVLAGALAIALVASALAGVVPAWRSGRSSVADTLKEGALQSSQGRSGRRLRRGMVVAQLALSVVLLVASGLAIRTFRYQLAADAGFDVSNLLQFTVGLPSARYPTTALRTQFFEEATDRLEAIPGVLGATMTSRLPVGASRSSLWRVFLFAGAPEPPAGPDYPAAWVTVDPGYFKTLDIHPLRGRVFTPDDNADAPPVILVNETMARRMSPDQEIVGRRMRSWRDENILREVVGVIPDVQFRTMAGREEPTVLVPAAQAVNSQMSFMVRTASDPGSLLPAVRATFQDLDPDLALADLGTLEAAHREGLSGVRFIVVIFGAFGGLALVLALGGVYGLVAYSVSQRTQEIGIRIAMGASGGSVQSALVAEGARLAAVGLTLGVALALVAAKAMGTKVVGLSLLDPRTFAEVVALLAAAVLLASWIPARRVSAVDPVEALRRE